MTDENRVADPAEAASVPRLDYAKAPPSAARRYWRRALLATLLVGLVVGGWAGYRRYHQEFAQRRALVKAYDQCVAFSAGPDLLVYGEFEDAKCMNDEASRTWDMGYTTLSAESPGGPPRMLALGLQPWFDIAQTMGLTGPGTGMSLSATVFCHGRRPAAGERRLVTVSAWTWRRYGTLFPGNASPNAGSGVQFVLTSIGPVRLFGGRPTVWQGMATLGAWPADAGTRVRFFAGQAHPTDGSRFSIGYSIGGVGGTIDGRLLDDGTVELGVRDGPLLGTVPGETGR